MKSRIAILTALVIVPVVRTAETPATPAAPSAPPPIPAVLSLAPADALGVVYLGNPAELFDHPLWRAVGATDDPVFAEMLKATAGSFSGPTMIAVCGTPLNPMSIRIELATQPKGGADAFFEQLHETWLPIMGKALMDPDVGVTPYGTLRAIRMPGPLPITVFAAEKRGIVYGSSRYNDVTVWLGEQEMPPRLASSDDFKKLSAEAVASADALIYVNARAWVAMVGMEFDRVAPGLFATLGLDRLEFGAMTAEWSRGNVAAEATLGFAEGPGGALDLLAPHHAPLEIAALIPDDYTFLVRGATINAADGVDRVNDILGAIDPDIVAEFRQECDEFRTEYGFDPIGDFVANLVDEWIVAARIDAGGSHAWLAAARLADPALLQAHAETLIREFGLDVDVAASGGAYVYSAPPTSGVRLAWATVGDYLVLSNRPDAIVEVAEVRQRQRGMLASAGLREVTRHLPAEPAKLAFVNLASLARLAESEARGCPDAAEIADALAALAQSNAGIGAAVTREGGVLTIRAAAGESVNRGVRELAWKSVAASTARTREMAGRSVSAANMRGIVTGCLMYANDHKGAWPTTFAELIQSGLVAPPMFRSPLDGSNVEITAENVDRVSSYLYRPGTGLAAADVVLCERELHEGGANFGFADSHVEWLTGPRAQELMASMESAARR